eukprot:Gb_12853 [translate_table: standard]
MDVVTGGVGNVMGNAVLILCATILEEIRKLIHLARDIDEMKIELEEIQGLVSEIKHRLEGHPTNAPKLVEDWLGKVQDSLRTAQDIVDAYGRLSFFFGWFKRPKLCKKTECWKRSIRELLEKGKFKFSLIGDVERIMSTVPDRSKRLLQPVPASGFVGEQMNSGKRQLQNWVIHDDKTRLIAVLGMGGVGKTSLLKTLNNNTKVRKAFDGLVIWITVSQSRPIKALQSSIAKRLNLELSEESSEEERAMYLREELENKRFLLILDDVWEKIDLENLGASHVCRGRGEKWKVVLSTRNDSVARTMNADRCIKIKPLSEEEGWQLFCRLVFTDRPVASEIEDIAKGIASECKGLPLALNVIGAAMRAKRYRGEWLLAFDQLKAVDNAFYVNNNIDRELLQRLKWSYNDLPKDLKLCFLCCADYPDDHRINVEELVHIWISEGLIKPKEPMYSMDVGHDFVRFLIDRCLIEDHKVDPAFPSYSDGSKFCKMHDVIRDLAIYIAENEHHWIMGASRHLKEFPDRSSSIEGCKKMSLRSNDIETLPNSLLCPSMVTLQLAWNESLKEVPEGFLTNLNSLKVLDLRWTKIYSLPTSIGQLKNLESLSVRATPISNLPETTCYLTRLEVLDISYCHSLKSLPRMSELRRLKHLNLRDCSQLTFLPFEISELISLAMLDKEGCSSMSLQMVRNEATFSDSRMMASVKDLMNLAKLKDLGLRTNEEIAVGVMGSWTEMRSLVLERMSDQEYLPEDMQEMQRLMNFALKYCGVVRMPDWIVGFQNLESLEFICCNSMKELGSLHRLPCLRRLKIHGNNIMTEMGADFGRTGGFPALETLFLDRMCSLQSIVGSDETGGMIEEGAMRTLQVLSVFKCMRLQKLPMGLEKLSSLRVLRGEKEWLDGLTWRSNLTKAHFEGIFRKIRVENSHRRK